MTLFDDRGTAPLAVRMRPRSLADVVELTDPPVAAAEEFFEEILVNAEDPAIRAARQGLLASLLHAAPAGIDWKALDTALS